MLTVLIPTKNRPSIVANQIKYLNKIEFPFPVIYVDASDDELFNKLGTYLERTKIKISIRHHKAKKIDSKLLSSRSYQQKLECLKLVRTPYVALAGDDDFHYPDGLRALVDAMESEPNASSCGGGGLTLEQGVDGSKLLHAGQVRVRRWEAPLVRNDDPFVRIRHHLATYAASYFNVRRTELTIRGMEAVENWEIRGLWPEVLESMALVSQGKFLRVPCRFLVRQMHHRSLTFKMANGLDILHPQFRESYLGFETELMSVLDRLSIAVPIDGRDQFRESLRYFISKRSSKYHQYPEENEVDTPDYMGVIKSFLEDQNRAGSLSNRILGHMKTNTRYFLDDARTASGDDF